MKLKSTNRLAFPLASALAALLSAQPAFAASLYWDTDDATAGAGGTAPAGAWTTGGTTWSSSPNGTVATAANTTAAADDLFFSAGTNATGSYTISLTDAQNAGSLTFQDGTATISGAGGVINLGGTGIINVPSSLLTVPNTALIGDNTDTIIGGATGLTKIGVGTLTLNGTAANTFTGGLNVNGGALGLSFANMVTPSNLINSGNALALGGGTVSITGNSTGTTDQTLGNVTVNSGGGSLLVNPNGGTATNITAGSLTAAASGGAFLVGRATGSGAGTLSITTTTDKDATGTYGGRVVFADGTANTGYDWATTVDVASPFAFSGYAGYTALDIATLGDVTDTNNSRITAGAVLPAASNRTTNSLKFENPATAQILDILAGNTLTLSGGGLLFTGASVAQGPRLVNGSITAGNGSGSYDLVVHQQNATAQSIAIGTTGANIALVSTISSNIVNNGANAVTVVKTGPGGLILSGTNAFTGGIVINGGTMAFNSLAALNNNKITANVNSTIHTFAGSSTTGDIELNNGSQLTILNNNSSFSVTGNVLGSGGMSAANGGQGAITLNLNGTGNNFSGPVRFTHNNGTQSATINVGSLLDTDTLGSGNITFGAGSASSISHNFGLATTAVAAVTLGNRRFQMASDQVNQQINNASGQALTINSDLLVTGTRAKNLVLGGAGAGISTFAGVIANHATPTAPGTVPIAVRQTAVVAAGGALTLASVEGIVAGATTITGTSIAAGTTIATVNPFTRQITLSAATTGAIALGTNFTIPNVVNSVSVTKSGAGTWVLSGDNSQTGPTLVSGGVLNIQHINALGATTTGTLVGAVGQLQLQGAFSYAAEPLTLTTSTGGSDVTLRSISGNNTWNGTIAALGGGASHLNRIQSDADTLTLAGNFSSAAAASSFVFQGTGNITATGQITGIAGVISGSVGSPAGVRTVNNDTNNYTGRSSVSGGVLAITSIDNVGATSSALGAPTTVADATIGLGSVASTGTLRYAGITISGHTSDRVINLGGTTGGGTIEANGTGPLVLTASNTATGVGIKTFTLGGTNTGNNSIGAIVDNSVVETTSVTKSDAGTWVLTGTNTYTGATTISAGTLLINSPGSLHASSAVTVGTGTGGTLGGNGTIGGNVTVAADGSLAPGASAGTLTISGNLDTSAQAAGTGKLNFELDALANTNDRIAVTGTLTIGVGVLGFSDFVFTNLGGLQVTGGTPYKLITSGGITALNTLDPANLTGTLPGGLTGTLQLNGGDVELAVTSGGNTYASWIATFPGVGGLNGVGDDADGDGSDNGVENFFGTDPSASSGGLVAGAVSGNTFTFTHPQNATPASDLTVAYQWSKNLATFYGDNASDGDSTVNFTTQADTPTPGTTTVTATVTGISTSKLFVNIKVTE